MNICARHTKEESAPSSSTHQLEVTSISDADTVASSIGSECSAPIAISNAGSSAVAAAVAMKNAQARVLASAITWPAEKSKLLYQRGNGVASTVRALTRVSFAQHAVGVASSAAQRGIYAGATFFTQSWLQQRLAGSIQLPERMGGSRSNGVMEHAAAGALTGVLAAPLVTLLESYKIRGEGMQSARMYSRSLPPMLLRHGVFEGAFFAVIKLLEDQHAGVRFAAAGAAASFSNLIFDVWKTRVIQRYPQQIPLLLMLRGMSFSEFMGNYVIKSTDICLNWFVAGCIKELLFDD